MGKPLSVMLDSMVLQAMSARKIAMVMEMSPRGQVPVLRKEAVPSMMGVRVQTSISADTAIAMAQAAVRDGQTAFTMVKRKRTRNICM